MTTTEGGRCVDTDQAFRSIAQRYRLGARQAQFFDDASGTLGEGLAGGRGPHGMGAAHEQAAAHGVLQAVDAARDRGRRQRMAPGSGRKTAAFEHVEEQAQLFGQGIGAHRRGSALRKTHSHCALLCVSPPAWSG
ncbi:hypothetical protein D3C76_1016680 [compost metagenome]